MAKAKAPRRRNPNPKLNKTQQKRRRNIDNARQRFDRQAARLEREGRNLGGRDGDLLLQAAERLREKSQNLKGINVREKLSGDVRTLISESKDYLASNLRSEWKRGETLGKTILSGSTEGHRFFAITESIWEGIPSTGRGDDRRLNAIRRALATPDNPRPNVLEMIKIIEDIADMDLGAVLHAEDANGDMVIVECSVHEGFMLAQKEFARRYG